MALIVHLSARRVVQPRPDEALVAAIAQNRWGQDNVFWLKEVAEVLSVLEETGGQATPLMHAALAQPLGALQQRLSFFPQYYRFFLAIALSAERLGLLGAGHAADMARWIVRAGWIDSELNDLNRAEARYLMQRAGLDVVFEPGLDQRLHRFMDRPETFAVPNRKAAYDLTHLVFYLSDHGARDPGLSARGMQSLHHAGTLAFLDQNADLLAEICLCLLYVGANIPDLWLDLVERTAKSFAFQATRGIVEHDDSHCLFVCNWLLGKVGKPAFQGGMPPVNTGQILQVRDMSQKPAALREVSMVLMNQGVDRTGDWSAVRGMLRRALSPAAAAVVDQAEQADPEFDAFFAAFARAPIAPVAAGLRIEGGFA